MNIQQIRSRVYNVARDARNLERLVTSETFARAWESASDAQRAELESYVLGIDKDKVNSWVKKVLAATSLHDKSVRELRSIAKAAGVQYVNHKDKDELIKEIET